jgi:hypothetical protein
MENSTLGKRGTGESANFEREVRKRVEIEPDEDEVLLNMNLIRVSDPNKEKGPLFIFNETTYEIKNIYGEVLGEKYAYDLRAHGPAYDKFYNSTTFVTPNYVKTNRKNWKEARPGEIKPYFTPYMSCSKHNNRFCSIFLFYKGNRSSDKIYEVSMKYFFDGFPGFDGFAGHTGFPRGVRPRHEFVSANTPFRENNTIYEAPPEIAEPYLEFLGMQDATNPTLTTLYALQNLPEKVRVLDPFVKSYNYSNLHDPFEVRARGKDDSFVERSGRVALPADIVLDLEEYIGNNSNARIGGKRKKRKSKRKCRRSRNRRTRKYRA